MMFQGLRTLIYKVESADLKKATEWYTKVLGQPPYFEESFYVGFCVGGFELGLDPSENSVKIGNNVETYWGVQNIQEAVAHCLKLGAKPDSEIRDVGSAIKVATVRDPFGNIFGLIENLGFKTQS